MVCYLAYLTFEICAEFRHQGHQREDTCPSGSSWEEKYASHLLNVLVTSSRYFIQPKLLPSLAMDWWRPPV
jgi:hypothetical protein